MENKKDTFQLIKAEGPEGLAKTLEDLLIKSRQDTQFAACDVLYHFGDQQSVIIVDFNQHPFQFYYNDLLGRPTTNLVKDVIAHFLWEKCSDKERADSKKYESYEQVREEIENFVKDYFVLEKLKRLSAWLAGAPSLTSISSDEAVTQLNSAIAGKKWSQSWQPTLFRPPSKEVEVKTENTPKPPSQKIP